MATKTIHTLAYKLLVDNRGFRDDLVASRAEINESKRVMRSVITPAEKIETAFAKLGRLLKKGAIDQDVFNRKAKQLRMEYEEASGKAQQRRDAEEALRRTMQRGLSLRHQLRTAEEQYADELRDVNHLLKKGAIDQKTYARAVERSKARLAANTKQTAAATTKTTLFAKATTHAKLALTGLATAFAGTAASRAVNVYTTQIDRFDKLVKTSDKLGISIENLTRIQFAAGKQSGLSAEQTAKGIEKMVRRVSEAAMGTGEARGVIQEIGLDAQKLASSTPDQAFLMIARAMDQVTNSGDRVRIATKLFDDESAALHTTLALSNAELEEMWKQSDRLNHTLNNLDNKTIAESKDTLTELGMAWEGMSTSFVVEFAPAVTELIKAITPLINMRHLIRETAIAIAPQSARPFLRAASVALPESDRNLAVFGKQTNGTNIGESQAAKAIEAKRKADEAELLAEKKKTAEKEKQRRLDAKRKADEALRNKVLAEAMALTESVKTAEERRADAIAKANDFRAKGAIDGDTHRRLISQADNTLKSELINRMRGGGESKTTGLSQVSIGPAASMAAGSSAAFAQLFRVNAIRQTEIDLARRQVDLHQQSLAELIKLNQQRENNGPRPRGLETV